jgi:integrase
MRGRVSGHQPAWPQRKRLAPAAVSDVLQKRAMLAGLDSKRVSDRSLRSGFATSAARAGVDEHNIMRQTRHTGVQMVRRYIQDGKLWQMNLSEKIGL